LQEALKEQPEEDMEEMNLRKESATSET